jgi:hypothetical protein
VIRVVKDRLSQGASKILSREAPLGAGKRFKKWIAQNLWLARARVYLSRKSAAYAPLIGKLARYVCNPAGF